MDLSYQKKDAGNAAADRRSSSWSTICWMVSWVVLTFDIRNTVGTDSCTACPGQKDSARIAVCEIEEDLHLVLSPIAGADLQQKLSGSHECHRYTVQSGKQHAPQSQITCAPSDSPIATEKPLNVTFKLGPRTQISSPSMPASVEPEKQGSPAI